MRELSLQNWSGSNYTFARSIDFSTLVNLENLNLTAFDAAEFPALPPSIQTLDISTWHACNFDSDVSQVHMTEAKMKALTSLSVSSPSTLCLTDICRLLEPNKGNLTNLDISRCIHLACEEIKNLINHGYLVSVIELKMRALPVDDQITKLLADRLHSLRSLDLGSTKVTGVGVKALGLKKGCKLERLGLNHCQAVNIDAVDWARARGIDVSFKFPEQEPGRSKRLRLF